MVRTLLALVICLPFAVRAEGEFKPKEDDDNPPPAAKPAPARATARPEAARPAPAPAQPAAPAATPAPAPADDESPPASSPTLTLNPEGKYQGVAPGSEALPPHPPKLPIKRGLQRLTWSGFQIKDGVPTVFLQLTAVPDYHIAEQKGAVVVTLKNTAIHLRNNRRPLRVEAFDTAVRQVEASSKGRDTRVTIHTKDAGNPAHKERVEQAAGGFQFLVIELAR